MKSDKFSWEGELTSVQPRIRLTRSFDQRSHSYLGYTLGIKGAIDGHDGEFLIGIGKAAQARVSKWRRWQLDNAEPDTAVVADRPHH